GTRRRRVASPGTRWLASRAARAWRTSADLRPRLRAGLSCCGVLHKSGRVAHVRSQPRGADMTTATAKIPQKLFTDLDDRGTIAEVPNVVARVLGGHRVELTGPVAEMAYLGDFIWQTAQGWDPARELYSAAKLLEVAARFPHAPAEDAEDEAPEASADLDANGPAPAIHATDEADERTACGDVVTIETFRTSSGREVTCPECLAANSVDEAPETETGSATAAAIERVWDV